MDSDPNFLELNFLQSAPIDIWIGMDSVAPPRCGVALVNPRINYQLSRMNFVENQSIYRIISILMLQRLNWMAISTVFDSIGAGDPVASSLMRIGLFLDLGGRWGAVGGPLGGG